MTDNRDKDASEPMHEAASAISGAAADLKAAATRKFDEAKQEVRTQADAAKASAADEVKDLALALRRASEELRSGSAQERTLGQIAGSLVDASDAIRDKDFGEIVGSVTQAARNNPALFLGGAMLLGFAASRYAKASADGGVASQSRPAKAQREQVAAYVNEGNPNDQPMRAQP